MERPWGAGRLVPLLVALLAACGGDGGMGTDDDDLVASVTVVPPQPEVDVGSTVQLAATVQNRRGEAVDAAVSWTSSDPSVATVGASTGLVSGISAGTARITATAGGVSGEATVTVFDPSPPDPPGDVTAVVVSDEAVEVGWTDNSDNETGFRVEREAVAGDAGAGGGSTEGAEGGRAVFSEAGTVGAGVTSFRDEALDPSTAYRYRVQACNDAGCSPDDAAGATSGTVTTDAELAMETVALPGGVVDEPYAAMLEASGGNGTFAWSVIDGALPGGLSLDAEGELSGTPTGAGTFAFTLRVSSGEQLVDREFSVTITEELLPPRVADVELPDAVVGQAYSAELQADRGNGLYAWAVVDGALPDGLSLSEGGVLSGAPAASGTFAFTVEVTSAGLTGSAELTLVVLDFPTLTVTTSDLPDGIVGGGYEAALEASGGDRAYAWSVTDGALPGGLALDESGLISGTPDAAGDFAFTVRVESGDGQEATAALEITVDPPGPVSILTAALHPAYQGLEYGLVLRAAGGDGTNYAWSLRSGALPSGLSLEADGTFSGAASTTGDYTFTLDVTSGGRVQAATFELRVVEHDPGRFDLTAINLTDPDPAIQARLEAALDRWEAIIVGDLPLVQQGELSSRSCLGFGELVSNAVTDDVMVLVNIAPIDGPAGTLGQAGPCGFVRTSGLPASGVLVLDEEDLEGFLTSAAGEARLEDILFHEIGHILGFGTLWNFADFFALLDGEDGIDPRFNGSAAVAQYGAVGGVGKVPVENDGGRGTRDGHWEETGTGPNDLQFDAENGRQGFDAEMMTGFTEALGFTQPVSRITIGAMADLGYLVSYDTADSFFLPTPPPSGAAAASAEADGSPGYDVLLREPLFVEMRDGSVRVLDPGR